MTTSRLIHLAGLLLIVVIALAGCGGGGETTEPSALPSVPPAADERWLSVIEAAPRADDLDALTRRVRDSLGPALVVSPVSCFEGLPAVAGEGYVIGAIAQSPDEAERLVSDTGEPVLFTASVTILCTD